MKKILLSVICFALVAFSLFGLTACYTSKPDTMDNLTGTYKLTLFTSKPKDAGQEVEPTDMIKEKGVAAYLIVKDDGTGYYAYKDNEKSWIRSVRITYSYDEEDASKVKELRYYDGMGADQTKRYPGTGRETLGLTFTKKEKKLHYNQPAVISVKQSTVVTYEKVNNGTDVNYVADKLSISATVCPFALNGLTTMTKYCEPESPYVYYFISFDPSGTKADIYYRLKESETPVHQTELPVTIKAPTDATGNYSITVGEVTYSRTYTEYDGLVRMLYLNYPATETEPARSEWFNSDSRTPTEIITAEEEYYAQYLEQQNNDAE